MTTSVTPMTDSQPQKKGFHLSLGSMVLIAGIVVTAIVFAVALARQNQTQPQSGPAPNFELTSFTDNTTLELKDLRGKVVVLNFWASWCGPCRLEAPELERAWQKYKDQDVVFLGVAYADNGPRSMEFMEEYGITYINGPDLGTRISEMYNIQGVPETFIIDKDGNVARFYYARVTEQELSSVIDPLLAAS